MPTSCNLARLKSINKETITDILEKTNEAEVTASGRNVALDEIKSVIMTLSQEIATANANFCTTISLMTNEIHDLKSELPR